MNNAISLQYFSSTNCLGMLNFFWLRINLFNAGNVINLTTIIQVTVYCSDKSLHPNAILWQYFASFVLNAETARAAEPQYYINLTNLITEYKLYMMLIQTWFTSGISLFSQNCDINYTTCYSWDVKAYQYQYFNGAYLVSEMSELSTILLGQHFITAIILTSF